MASSRVEVHIVRVEEPCENEVVDLIEMVGPHLDQLAEAVSGAILAALRRGNWQTCAKCSAWARPDYVRWYCEEPFCLDCWKGMGGKV